jgi:hypothetical protein
MPIADCTVHDARSGNRLLRCAVLPNVAGLSPRITAMNAALSLEPAPTLPSVQRLLQQVHPTRLVGAVVLVREHGVLRHASATGLADRESARRCSATSCSGWHRSASRC